MCVKTDQLKHTFCLISDSVNIQLTQLCDKETVKQKNVLLTSHKQFNAPSTIAH